MKEKSELSHHLSKETEWWNSWNENCNKFWIDSQNKSPSDREMREQVSNELFNWLGQSGIHCAPQMPYSRTSQVYFDIPRNECTLTLNAGRNEIMNQNDDSQDSWDKLSDNDNRNEFVGIENEQIDEINVNINEHDCLIPNGT